MTDPDVIIGVDPGGTTGLCWWRKGMRGDDTYAWEQVPNCDTDEQLKVLMQMLSAISGLAVPYVRRHQVHIVVEKFEFRLDERERTKIDYTAAQVIGAIRFWAMDLDHIKLVRRGATIGKGFWTDDKIKTLALWVPGNKHAMDATRHLLSYRLFELQHKALLEPFRPQQ